LNRLVPLAFLALLLLTAFPLLPSAQGKGTPQISVNSQYVVNRYGYAIINETVQIRNNGSSSIEIPDLPFGFGSLSPQITDFNVTGAGYSVSLANEPQGQVFLVSGGGSLAAGAESTFSLRALARGIVSTNQSGSLGLLVLNRPYFGFEAASVKLLIKMPASTQLRSTPQNYTLSAAGTNITYYRTVTNEPPQPAITRTSPVQLSAAADFHPLIVHSAKRMIGVSDGGSPVVTDFISLQNLGKSPVQLLTVAPLTSVDGRITVLPSGSPPLLNPANLLLTNRAIDLVSASGGLPIDPGANFTIAYRYPLAQQYYTVAGGVVSIKVPLSPPIATFVNTFSIGLALPAGIKALSGATQTLKDVSPFQKGTAQLSYSLSVGWALDAGVPVASFLFVLALIGLFAARSGMASEEAKEVESATERASEMIEAFEEKTSLINGIFEEMSTAEASELTKAYFDELRGRLDVFRSRALQRLNEVKQKSTTQKFFDLLGQVHNTEREVDRAAKDMLNLYEQYHTKRMRNEVFERLLPNYRRRLEKTLNQLSDELNTAQREAKLL